MSTYRTSVVALCIGLGATSTVQAQSGTITFVGQIVEETCVVVPIGAAAAHEGMLSVPLPDTDRRSLARPGARSTAVNFGFQIGSKEHPCRQRRMRARFFDAGDTSAQGRLINRGEATNVEILVQDAAGKDLDLQRYRGEVLHSDASGVALLRWKARYYATGASQPGSVVSRLHYLVDYP